MPSADCAGQALSKALQRHLYSNRAQLTYVNREYRRIGLTPEQSTNDGFTEFIPTTGSESRMSGGLRPQSPLGQIRYRTKPVNVPCATYRAVGPRPGVTDCGKKRSAIVRTSSQPRRMHKAETLFQKHGEQAPLGHSLSGMRRQIPAFQRRFVHSSFESKDTRGNPSPCHP